MKARNDNAHGLDVLLRTLKLPTVSSSRAEVAAIAESQGWTFEQYLHHLVELEVEERRRKRIERNLKRSSLPADKTLATLDIKKLPAKVARVLPSLCEGGFCQRAENILAFGNPGTGKSHVAAAIGHELVHRGFEVLYVPCPQARYVRESAADLIT